MAKVVMMTVVTRSSWFRIPNKKEITICLPFFLYISISRKMDVSNFLLSFGSFTIVASKSSCYTCKWDCSISEKQKNCETETRVSWMLANKIFRTQLTDITLTVIEISFNSSLTVILLFANSWIYVSELVPIHS